MPLLGPTVRFPFVGSYFVVRGFTGLVRAEREDVFIRFFILNIENCQVMEKFFLILVSFFVVVITLSISTIIGYAHILPTFNRELTNKY